MTRGLRQTIAFPQQLVADGPPDSQAVIGLEHGGMAVTVRVCGQIFRLVVYGDSPRSARARRNAREALDARGIDHRTLEIVDTMADPRRTLELQRAVVPQLVLGSLRSNWSLYGDLSDRDELDRWLDQAVAAANDNPSATR